jgi:mono/diheme cytochrome c family protein
MRTGSALMMTILLMAACGGGASAPQSGERPRLASAGAGQDYERVMLTLPAGDPAAGRQAFVDLQCTACHRVTGDATLPQPFSDNLGPDLDARRPHRSASELAEAIVAPSHSISTKVSPEVKARLSGALSPMGDFSRAMTVRQLSDVVAFLRAPRQGE